MNEEVKDTKDILNTADVEARIYHAFEVFKYLPPVKPQGYFNIFRFIKPEPGDIVEQKPVFCTRDYTLAEEVALQWWDWLHKGLDLETLELIKYRCGAPIIKGGKQIYNWTHVRRWKMVGAEFGIHRNIARKKWNKALNIILEVLKSAKKC